MNTRSISSLLFSTLLLSGCGTGTDVTTSGTTPPDLSRPPAHRAPPVQVEMQQFAVDATPVADADQNGLRTLKVVATADVTSNLDLTRNIVIMKLRGGPKNMTYSDKAAEVVQLPDGKLQFTATLRHPPENVDYQLAFFAQGQSFYETPFQPPQ